MSRVKAGSSRQAQGKGLALAAISCAVLTVAAGGSAQAATYTFAFSDTTAMLDSFGTVTTSDLVNAVGGYDVTSISGVVFGAAITGLIANPDQPNASNYVIPGAAMYYIYDNV